MGQCLAEVEGSVGETADRQVLVAVPYFDGSPRPPGAPARATTCIRCHSTPIDPMDQGTHERGAYRYAATCPLTAPGW